MSCPRTFRHTRHVAALCVASILCGATASGQQPDGWERAAEHDFNAPAQPPPAPPDNSGVGALFYQLQLLQDDVRQLRGVIEEQQHRIDRLVRDQRERYVDLDTRLAQLQDQEPAAGTASAPATRPVPVANETLTEEGAYGAAVETMRAGRTMPADQRSEAYDRALEMFAALVAGHPDGQFTANAFYWQGEIRLYRDENELARQAFAQLLNVFPDHAKVPDALYKLGVAHHRLGDNAEAARIMARVTNEFPDHPASRLARAYAEEMR